MRNLIYKAYIDNYNIDLSVHKCNKYLYTEIEQVFKNSFKKKFTSKDDMINNLKIICTWQKSNIPINIVNDEVSTEMDRLYKNFLKYICNVKKKIEEKGFWIDASDPHTGKCLFGEKTNVIYNELQSLKYLLKYESEKLGCCGMILHPKYYYHGYPITFFTNANMDILKNALIIS